MKPSCSHLVCVKTLPTTVGALNCPRSTEPLKVRLIFCFSLLLIIPLPWLCSPDVYNLVILSATSWINISSLDFVYLCTLVVSLQVFKNRTRILDNGHEQFHISPAHFQTMFWKSDVTWVLTMLVFDEGGKIPQISSKTSNPVGYLWEYHHQHFYLPANILNDIHECCSSYILYLSVCPEFKFSCSVQITKQFLE